MNKLIKYFLLVPFTITLALPATAFKPLNDYKEIIDKDPESNYVFLFVFRSAEYLDWSNPSDLAKTTLKSQIMKKLKGDASSIGHAQIAWHCNDGNNVSSGATGQTGQHGDEGFQLVKNGWGLSTLDTVFTDGYLESEDEVNERVKIADSKNNLAWVAFKTDYKSCMGMSDFVKAYDKSGAAVNYGFPVDPLKYEGAGCTSFANASIYKTGLNIGLSEGWIRKVNIPFKYMGKLKDVIPNTRPLEAAKSYDEEKKVAMTDFLFSKVSWAEENEPHKPFYYYDPELFYESLIHIENKYREKIGIRSKNPIRTNFYDQYQKNTKKVSESWIEQVFEQNKSIKMEKLLSSTGLIINLK
ncbi:MAG: hypothetical protein ACK4IX_01075 [Candidatus Sericytochromatia bacterium]